MDITKQFQKSIGKILERVEQANAFYYSSGNFKEGYLAVNKIIKDELWGIHDVLKLQIENEVLKKRVGE